jgi:hypothetical protein
VNGTGESLITLRAVTLRVAILALTIPREAILSTIIAEEGIYVDVPVIRGASL